MGTAATLAIGALSMIASTAISYAMTPSTPSQDLTDYDMLRRTQEQADAEAEAQKQQQLEAKKREELRMQQMYGRDIKTSENGVEDLAVKNQVLGSKDDENAPAVEDSERVV